MGFCNKGLHTFHCYFSAAALTTRLIENLAGVVSTVTQRDILYLKSGDAVLQTDIISATSRQLTVVKEPGSVKLWGSFDGALQPGSATLLPDCGGFQPLYKDWRLWRGVQSKRAIMKSKKSFKYNNPALKEKRHHIIQLC